MDVAQRHRMSEPEVGGPAEGAWRAVIDAQRDDLVLLRRRWPDRTSPESAAAVARLRARAAAGGDADRAVGAVEEAYGGAEGVPDAVRGRLERYAWEQLGGGAWPARDLAESTEEPAIVRKARRRRRQQGGSDQA